MSNEGWSDEASQAKPAKRRIPTWAWWTCGSGCLLMTLVVVAIAVFAARVARDFMDPEKAWEDVRAILPYDQRPPGWEAHGVTVLGMGNYFLTPPEPDVMLVVQRFRRTAEHEAMFDPQSTQNRGLMMFEEIRAPEAGTLEVQGREVRVLRFRGGLPGGIDADSDAAGIRIDLSRPDLPALVQISLDGAKGREPVSQARVAELLAPFDVWSER